MSEQPLTPQTGSLFSESAEIRLYKWRKSCFVHLGFGEAEAGQLAQCKSDHHQAKRMMDQGCTRDLVLRIMT